MKNRKPDQSPTLRQKLWMLYHEDGILDLMVGLTVALLASVMAFDSVVFIGLIGIPIVLYIPVKEQLAIPRIGLIRFEAQDVTRRRMAAFALAGLGTFAVFALLFLLRSGASPGLKDLLSNNMVLIFALVLGTALFAAGRILNNARFGIYALLGLGLVLAAHFTGLRVWMPVALVGLVMVVAGTYKLTRFLREYPLEGEK